jgi:hypothetical protein
MQYEILDAAGEVINTIVADAAFVEKAYPGRWREVGAAPTEPTEPALARRTLTRLGVRNRFTAAEKTAIYAAAATPEGLAIRIFLDDLQAAEDVALDDPALAQGLALLETAGLIGPGRAREITDDGRQDAGPTGGKP